MQQNQILRKINSTKTPKCDLDELEERLSGGLIFTNNMCSMNQEDIKENKAILHSLIELLISKGFIHLHELEERKEKVIQSFGQNDEQLPKVHLMETTDKYEQGSEVIIDCESHYHICKGVCCQLWFALSVQDLYESIVKWDYMQPFGIARHKDGYCIHKDYSTHKCTIYENRPLLCKTYDCRSDKRIWIDFENKIINPDLGLNPSSSD